MKILEVKIKYVFGTLRIYPANDLAKKVVKNLLGRTCVTYPQISEMKQLGYKFLVTDAPIERQELARKIEA